jgi:hypothetical protein
MTGPVYKVLGSAPPYRYGKTRPIRQPQKRLPLAKQADVGEILGSALLRRLQESNHGRNKGHSHCPGLTAFWARWLDPNGSPLST